MKVEELDKYLGDVLFYPEQQKLVEVKLSDGKDEIEWDDGEVLYGLPIDEIESVTEWE